MTSPRNRSSAPSRLRAQHRNITTTRWRLCVTMETECNVAVADVFYIFNSTVVDWTCGFFFVMYVRNGNFILLRLDFDRTWKSYSIGYHMLRSMGPVTSHVLIILFVWRLKRKHIHDWICWSGVCPKLRKQLLTSSCLSVSRSVYLSVRIELLGFHWMGFREIWCLWICGKYVDIIIFW